MELAKAKGGGAGDEDDINMEADPDYIESINQLCNRVLRALLSSDIQKILSLKDELNGLGETCVESNHPQGALFMYVLYKLCENAIPKEVDQLEGVYHSAFIKIFNMLEDSGWGMQKEGQEIQEMIDEEMFQQPPRMGYYN